jgi:hypothetical protein
MVKLRNLRKLPYQFLTLVVLTMFLVVLPTLTPGSQTSCCQKCLERFFQCDANDIVCCQIYSSCAQQCQGGCSGCPN